MSSRLTIIRLAAAIVITASLMGRPVGAQEINVSLGAFWAAEANPLGLHTVDGLIGGPGVDRKGYAFSLAFVRGASPRMDLGVELGFRRFTASSNSFLSVGGELVPRALRDDALTSTVFVEWPSVAAGGFGGFFLSAGADAVVTRLGWNEDPLSDDPDESTWEIAPGVSVGVGWSFEVGGVAAAVRVRLRDTLVSTGGSGWWEIGLPIRF